MSFIKDILRLDLVNNENLLEKVIREWTNRYQENLNKLSIKFDIRKNGVSTSDSDSERDYSISNNNDNNNNDTVYKLIKEAVECKAYAETEYHSIKDIRTELEDCQMIKELGLSLRKMEEEKSEQNIKLKNLSSKNLELLQEKQNLEKSLHELSIQNKKISEKISNGHVNEKSALTAKLEALARTQIPKRINKNPEYCHIAPNITLFSDSELSISEEDSLEKDKNREIKPTNCNQSDLMNGRCINSPDKFKSGLEGVSKSTPMKGFERENFSESHSHHTNAISNLTQDLKEIQKYFDKTDDSFVNQSQIFDWEMSQISIDDHKDQNTSGSVLEGKEDPDDDQLPICSDTCQNSCCKDEKMIKYASTITSNIIHSSQNFIQKMDSNMFKLQNELINEKDKFNSLSNLVSDLYSLIHKPVQADAKEVPTCSGDQPLHSKDIPTDPLEQMRKIKMAIDNKLFRDKELDKVEELESPYAQTKEVYEAKQNYIDMTESANELNSDEINTNIFKLLSETSVRLLTEMVSSINKINCIFAGRQKDSLKNVSKDYTPLVTEYLQYLMTLECVDFNNENSRQHPIFDMLNELQTNIQKMSEKQLLTDRDDNGISRSLESYYQEQLNKCYDDISRLKQQLESTQQLLTSKLPADAAQALFEAKQKLQSELESVDREYARQMARERKRLEESENSYNDLLSNHENMQKTYNEDINALNQQIEILERKIEADRRFIDQQQFEWELERTQHNVDIENLNRSMDRIKRPRTPDTDIKDSADSSSEKKKIQKYVSLHKSKHRSISLESNEVSYNDNSTQTVGESVILLKSKFLVTDLEKYEEFRELREAIQNNQKILFDFIHILSDSIFEIVETNHFQVTLEILQEFNTKNISEIHKITDFEWNEMREEILKVQDFFTESSKEKAKLKENCDRLQEELESNSINVTIKQDMIKALEEEIQSLVDFQRNLSKDYDLLQAMAEEKQNELDKLSSKLLSQKTVDDFEENIRALKKELTEKQNIIDERDEDLYVIKEEKEILEQELQSSKLKYEATVMQNKDIYQDLEKEVKDLQKTNSDLLEQKDYFSKKHSEMINEIENLKKTKESLMNQIEDANLNYDILTQKNISLVDQNRLTELRLSEIKDQHKFEISKINASLEEIESMNRKLMEENKKHKVIMNTSSCQTETIVGEKFSNDSLTSFVNIQDKLIKTVEKLKKEYIYEKELRHQIEAKYKQFASQYESLSNKVTMLGNRVNSTKLISCQEIKPDFNVSLESTDVNDLLNESQVSLDDDIEFNKLLQECSNIIPSHESCQAVAIQTDLSAKIHDITNYQNMFPDIGYISYSDWLPDLLKEVETVLQSCVIGEDIPREILPKMNKFRDLLEQMYKRQLTILLNKISCMEHEIQLQKKTNQELKYKSDFIMTELQEKDSSLKNLRVKLDQELTNNSRLSENHRNITDQNRILKSDLTNQMLHVKDDLERERNKCSDLNRLLKNEQHSREQLEAALSVSDERLKLVEQSNAELIKKSRQQTDYIQKEKDSFNTEYAEIFRRCNNYKIQIESLQQNLQYQIIESEKTKTELQETIQSNTEYRDKMNEFVKIYQERRKKLETEVNELHQLLQISCRREITFVKENETLRIKCQSMKNICKDYERRIKELERFVSDLHLKHEEDRQDWLNIINGNIDAKDKDEGILSQVNWLLKMLQLRIELLALHFSPTTSGENHNDLFGDSYSKSVFKSRPYSADSTLNRSNSELLVLLQSIKSMQSMINLYLNRSQKQLPQHSNYQSTEIKGLSSEKTEKYFLNQSNISNRPKPTGSSDSLDSITDTESMSEPRDHSFIHQDIDSLSTKIYIIQTNKIIELQSGLDKSERWRQQLISQKEYILSQLPSKLRNYIVTPLLTDQQKLIIQRNFFKFKLKAVAVAIIAYIKFFRIIQSTNSKVSLSSRLNKVGSQLQQPKFSITPNSISCQINNSNRQPNSIPAKDRINCNTGFNKTETSSSHRPNGDLTGKYNEPLVLHSRNYDMKISSSETPNESLDSGIENRAQASHTRYNITPTTSVSPILERRSSRPNSTNTSAIPRLVHKSTSSAILSLSHSSSNSFRRSLPMPSTNRESLASSVVGTSLDKSTNFSNTLKQIDDFGKRLDKYTDVSSCT